MISYGINEWLWAMFELTPTWPTFNFGQPVLWIGENNYLIWLSMGYTSDSDQCSNRLLLNLVSLMVNVSNELGQIMTRYYFI